MDRPSIPTGSNEQDAKALLAEAQQVYQSILHLGPRHRETVLAIAQSICKAETIYVGVDEGAAS